MNTECRVAHMNASALMESFLVAVKEYESHYLNQDPNIATAYRYLGLYRLFSHPLAELHNEATWFFQLIVETEMSRDHVIIDTVDQLDEYYANFVQTLKTVNPAFDEESPMANNIRCAFNNIYDAKGFMNEKE